MRPNRPLPLGSVQGIPDSVSSPSGKVERRPGRPRRLRHDMSWTSDCGASARFLTQDSHADWIHQALSQCKCIGYVLVNTSKDWFISPNSSGSQVARHLPEPVAGWSFLRSPESAQVERSGVPQGRSHEGGAPWCPNTEGSNPTYPRCRVAHAFSSQRRCLCNGNDPVSRHWVAQ